MLTRFVVNVLTRVRALCVKLGLCHEESTPNPWTLNAEAPVSESKQPWPANVGQATTPDYLPNPSGPPILNKPAQTIDEFNKEQSELLWKPLGTWLRLVEVNVTNELQGIRLGTVPTDPDSVFGAHTAFVKFALKNNIRQYPILCWEQTLAPLVAATEDDLRKRNPNARLHKGAPLFNVGVCHFANGDLEDGFKYLSSAGKEDELSGRGSRFPILIGDHPLSKKFLLGPVVGELLPSWQADYISITRSALHETELAALIKQTALRPADGIQVVLALHRLLKANRPPNNDWSSFLQTRALGDILVALESMLRRVHQPLGIESELHAQLTVLLQANVTAANEFNSFHNWFIANVPQNMRKSPQAVNACVTEALNRMAGATTASAKAGIACYIAVRLRNSLLHVLEDSLDIYTDKSKCITMFGYALAVLRIVKHGEDGTLAGL
jgi:hypothetical protein